MSFFFDVWTNEGFILASDVKLLVNDESHYIHKIAVSAQGATVPCAIATCGDYVENSLRYFVEATVLKDTLREVAKHFAEKWTRRYAGTEEYSAVHLVGFERIPQSGRYVPQVWYWHNYEEGRGFLSEERLQMELSSFAEPVPANNHLPWL